MTNKIKAGDKIKTTYQNWYTVMSVNGNIIAVHETNNKINIHNVVTVKAA